MKRTVVGAMQWRIQNFLDPLLMRWKKQQAKKSTLIKKCLLCRVVGIRQN